MLPAYKVLCMLAVCIILCPGTSTIAHAEPVFDPLGDTFGTGAIRPDITSINATFSVADLTFSVFFASSISPPSAGAPNSVGGFIDIDTDQNPDTGDQPFINVFGPEPRIGIELGQDFFLDVFSESEHPGFVDVYRTLPDTITGMAPSVFTPTSFSVTVPLTLLGGDNGLVNYGVIIGTASSPTDLAPNGSTPATSQPIPEPGTWLLLATGCLGLLALGWRRRQRTA